MITNKKYGRDFHGVVNISRMYEYELDEAILNLEERGYELIDRGVEVMSKHQFTQKRWAKLRKIEQHVTQPV